MKIFAKIERPDDVAFVLLFNACARSQTTEALNYGRKIFYQLPKSSHRNDFILTAALDMFVKCGDRANAENVFSQIKRDAADYGQMMKYFNQNKMPLKTLDLFQKMKNEGVEADLISYLLLIDAYSQIRLQSKCRSMVKEIPTSMLQNIRCQTALIDMWVSLLARFQFSFIHSQLSREKPVQSIEQKQSLIKCPVPTSSPTRL